MAEKKQDSNMNMAVVALVALVAIVGLVALVMNAATVKEMRFAKGSQLVQAEDLSQKSCSDNAVGNTAWPCKWKG